MVVPRVVLQIPLAELWDDSGAVGASRMGHVGRDRIKTMLRAGPVRAAIADVGEPLAWVPDAEFFAFWRQEASPHLAEPDERVDLDAYPEGYCYFASEWRNAADGSVVLLFEKAH